MQAQGRGAHCLCRADALAVGVGRRIVRAFGIEGAVGKQRVGALVALLLQSLRAHGAEEAMRGERDMCSACGRRRSALGPQAAGDADAALHTTARAESLCPRPSFLAARMRRPDGRRARGGQAWLSRGARHAQHAAATREALLFGCRHGLEGVAVAVHVVTSCMTWRKGRARVREDRRLGGRSDGVGRSV